MSPFFSNDNNQLICSKISLFYSVYFFQAKIIPKRKKETSSCTCLQASLMVETAAVLPFFACFLVFILYFFRILQVQADVVQSLQYTGRVIAAQYSEKSFKDENSIEKVLQDNNMVNFAKTEVIARKKLKEMDCPFAFVEHGLFGIHFLGSDMSGHYVLIKAEYQMVLPVGLLGKIKYPIVQQAKCRKWTGYQLGQDDTKEDEWLYYTPHGTVYHASRQCAYLDLSIHGVAGALVSGEHNQSGGRYAPCEICAKKGQSLGMVYVTNFGDRYHTTLSCSGLKRTVYMIRRKDANKRRLCRKCGGT